MSPALMSTDLRGTDRLRATRMSEDDERTSGFSSGHAPEPVDGALADGSVAMSAAGVGRRSPRLSRPDLPVTGAWRPGDPAGDRQFVSTEPGRRFALEGGGVLDELTVAYETWGELDAAASNAVLVCHALTGDSHAAGPAASGHVQQGWWSDLIGPGRSLDTDRWFVVCANVLGGCQGTTGPASIAPGTGAPYGSAFPVVTIRDTVRTQALVADALGIDQWMSVVGGSMGGMQALEWGVMYPARVRSVAALASTAAASAQQIAWSNAGRNAIALDPRWRNGDYYDAEPGDGPAEGLALARSIAQVHYRSELVFEQRFGRDEFDAIAQPVSIWDRFQVESYLDYHGEKLALRFDANSYLVLNKMMDLHDIGRGRGGVAEALRRLGAPTMIGSVASDWLYPPYQQRALADLLDQCGNPCEWLEIDSPHGHDGFLLEFDQIGPALSQFLVEVEKSGAA